MADDSGKPITEMTFEEALAELESVVGRLETGEVPLEQSITLYERGDALKKHCEKKLHDAELKVERIVQGSDAQATGAAPFEAG